MVEKPGDAAGTINASTFKQKVNYSFIKHNHYISFCRIHPSSNQQDDSLSTIHTTPGTRVSKGDLADLPDDFGGPNDGMAPPQPKKTIRARVPTRANPGTPPDPITPVNNKDMPNNRRNDQLVPVTEPATPETPDTNMDEENKRNAGTAPGTAIGSPGGAIPGNIKYPSPPSKAGKTRQRQ
eukprot:GHVS01103840.1.p1 GENE.GHVS01103840.1~~GHVS01103840.1.p1  ORF type:complete len:181 (+),score=18.85 GHVS01103840.1:108-650(+)